MIKTPKRTIFTPTCNRAYILEKLYRSLRRQTCREFEWLIIDDGSADDTGELVARCSLKFCCRMRNLLRIGR